MTANYRTRRNTLNDRQPIVGWKVSVSRNCVHDTFARHFSSDTRRLGSLFNFDTARVIFDENLQPAWKSPNLRGVPTVPDAVSSAPINLGLLIVVEAQDWLVRYLKYSDSKAAVAWRARGTPTSWACFVITPDTPAGATNALRFATKAEAEGYGRELLSRWFVPTSFEARPSSDPVNYRFDVELNRAIALRDEVTS